MFASQPHTPDSLATVILITVFLGWSLEVLVRGLM